MIKDSELLKLIMERYPEQPFDFILEQFTIFKAGLIEANGKLAERDKAEDISSQQRLRQLKMRYRKQRPICLQLSQEEIHETKFGGEAGRSDWKRVRRVLPVRQESSEPDGKAFVVPWHLHG